MEDLIRGTIKIEWSIPERDARCPPDEHLTRAQILSVLDRIEEAVCEGLPQDLELYLDGEDKPPVRLSYDTSGADIEIDEGPEQLLGTIDYIRQPVHYDGDSELDDD